GGIPWVQLPRSPRRAYCMATDPDDVNHVVVGERAGNAVDPADNTSGVWESTDGGFSWTKILDPRVYGAVNQVIPSLVFTPERTLVIATEVGLFRRPFQGSMQKVSLPSGGGDSLVTAVVASVSKVWARLRDYTLFVSGDDGVTWVRLPMQPV